MNPSTAKMHPRTRQLAANIAAAFVALASIPATVSAAVPPALWTVDTCQDVNSGDLATKTGSLRFAVANASSESIIDLSQLPACSVITLHTGAVAISQYGLTLQGPTNGQVTITGRYSRGQYMPHRIINHQGIGTLSLNNVAIEDGHPTSTTTVVKGGCIYSKGSVSLSHSGVYGCYAKGKGAVGGGIAAAGGVTLVDSAVSANVAADNGSGFTAIGGGVAAKGLLYLSNSTISYNQANANAAVGTKYYGGGPGGRAGGAEAYAGAVIVNSTISGNKAAVGVGGMEVGSSSAGSKILNSTISGNYAPQYGGLAVFNTSLTISNSTIAFNSEFQGCFYYSYTNSYGQKEHFNRYYGSGVNLNGTATKLTLQSSILSNNTYAHSTCKGPVKGESDLIVADGSASGSNNAIHFAPDRSSGLTNTVTGCPLLGPLRNNGGSTRTHALFSHSPAIDAGGTVANDPATNAPFAFDQRGTPFGRLDHGVVDIGAYEVQQEDVVFNSGFDGCL